MPRLTLGGTLFGNVAELALTTPLRIVFCLYSGASGRIIRMIDMLTGYSASLHKSDSLWLQRPEVLSWLQCSPQITSLRWIEAKTKREGINGVHTTLHRFLEWSSCSGARSRTKNWRDRAPVSGPVRACCVVRR